MRPPTTPHATITRTIAPIVLPKKPSQKDNPQFDWRWLSPQYWPLWCGFALLWLYIQLPYPVLYVTGKFIGRMLWLLGRERRYITARNLELCFPEMSPRQRQRILLESFDSLGMTVFEMAMGWWWPDWRLKRIARVHGLQHLPKKGEQGAVLLAMHFTTLDIGAMCLSSYYKFGGMYRPHKNPLFNYIQCRGRSRAAFREKGDELVVFPREDLRTMLQLLRRGDAVWYAPDQDYGAQHSVFVPFFGVPAATITATAKLVTLGRAQVLPFTHRRLPWARGYEVTVHPPLQNYPEGDEYQDAARISAFIQEQVRQCPGQYLWSHRRFKSRPAGESTLYPGLKKYKK